MDRFEMRLELTQSIRDIYEFINSIIIEDLNKLLTRIESLERRLDKLEKDSASICENPSAR